MWNNNQTRIQEIKNAPFSWKDRDILTGAEKYMEGAIDLCLVKMTIPCFRELTPDKQEKISLVWKYATAAYHLKKDQSTIHPDVIVQQLKNNAARIYELECQRILGSLFFLENDFWKAFYKRQEVEADKILVALDALHYASTGRHAIAYQLLIQAFRKIIKGHYTKGKNRNTHFKNAKRLLVDLPLSLLQTWLSQQLIK